jgi:hypothetical protein
VRHAKSPLVCSIQIKPFGDKLLPRAPTAQWASQKILIDNWNLAAPVDPSTHLFFSKGEVSHYILHSDLISICLPILEHNLYRHKQAKACKSHKSEACRGISVDFLINLTLRTFPARHHPFENIRYTISANHKTNQIGGHHHQDVEDCANCTNMSVPRFVTILHRKHECIARVEHKEPHLCWR